WRERSSSEERTRSTLPRCTSPASGSSSPAAIFSSVVLPSPRLPATATISLLSTCSETSERTLSQRPPRRYPLAMPRSASSSPTALTGQVEFVLVRLFELLAQALQPLRALSPHHRLVGHDRALHATGPFRAVGGSKAAQAPRSAEAHLRGLELGDADPLLLADRFQQLGQIALLGERELCRQGVAQRRRARR